MNRVNQRFVNRLQREQFQREQIRDKARDIMYVGIDLHKQFLQVAVINNKGKVTRNVKVKNTQEAIKQAFRKMPHSLPKSSWNHHQFGMAYTRVYA